MNWKALLQNVLSAVVSAALGALVHSLTNDPSLTVGTMAVAAGGAHALPSPWKEQPK